MNLFLWGALPYIAFTFLIVGTLVRFFYFERNWTTKSSEFLEKKQLRIANPLFHWFAMRYRRSRSRCIST